MIRSKKILSGILTAALIFGSHSALNVSVYASEQQKSKDSIETETVSESGKDTETASKPTTGISKETSSEAAGNTESQPDADSQTSAETDAESGRNPEANSEIGSDKNSETNSEIESGKNSESASNAESEKNSEADSNAESEKNSEANSENAPEKNSEADSDTESEKTSEADSDMNTETNSEIESGEYMETESEQSTESQTETGVSTESEETESQTETESSTESEETESQTETETDEVLSKADPDSSVPADVFKVVLPTIPEDDTTFDYILDPQGLIELTDAQKYGGSDEVEFAHDKTLYFKTSRTDDGRPVYDNVSNALTVTNMSSRDVKITVKATITPSDNISMSDSDTFDADNTSASIYLALTDGTNTIPITSDAAILNASIDAPEDAYETVWDGEKNVYELTDAAKEDHYEGFKTYSFWLTGACNANADWLAVEGQIPEVHVVWEVE